MMKLFRDLKRAAGLQFTLLFGFMGTMGLLLLVASVFTFFITFNFVRHSLVTNGTVIKLVSHSSKGGTVYSHEVRFLASERSFQFEGNGASYPPVYHVEQVVRVRFDPSDPTNASIDTPFQVWTNFIIFVALGIIFTVAPGLVFYFMLRSARTGRAPPRKRRRAGKKAAPGGSGMPGG